MIFVVLLMTPEYLGLVLLLQLLLHRGSVLFLCWNPGTSLGGVPLSGSNSSRRFRMLTVSRQDQTLASSSSAWRKGYILISIHKERWIFVYSFSVCASCARLSIISLAEVHCLCSAQLFPEQKWVFTYQKRRAHFFQFRSGSKNLTPDFLLLKPGKNYVYDTPCFSWFFWQVRSCYNSVGAEQGPSAQTAHLSVLWTPAHCQVSALSQFPIHTLYYAAQDIYIVEVK